jgi:hypothetical protein
MMDFNKKVKNPLLNTAVTGGTIEDFSQHALLLPAKEKPPPVLNLLPGESSDRIYQKYVSGLIITKNVRCGSILKL